jgi:hypothetical protein
MFHIAAIPLQGHFFAYIYLAHTHRGNLLITGHHLDKI